MVWLTSEAFTVPLPVVSPTSTPICTGKSPPLFTLQQLYRDPLGVGYASEIDGNISRPAAAAAANCSRARGDRRIVESDRAGEAKDDLVIIGRSTTAAFDAGAAR